MRRARPWSDWRTLVPKQHSKRRLEVLAVIAERPMTSVGVWMRLGRDRTDISHYYIATTLSISVSRGLARYAGTVRLGSKTVTLYGITRAGLNLIRPLRS